MNSAQARDANSLLFRQQLRPVQKFENATDLQQQIARDVDAARRCLTA